MLQQICAVQFRICVQIRIQVFHQALASKPVGRKKTDIQNIRHISGNNLGLQAVDARVPLLFICRGIVVVLGVIRHVNAVVRIAAVKSAYHSAGKGIQVHNCKTEHFLLRCLTWGRLRQNDQVVFDPVHGLLGGGGDDSASSKQIHFIDYDGTIVESYTKSEWQNVTALPSNPSHSGLTAQGWNWTKAQIDEQLTAMPDNDVWVGQMYITDDGKTRVYIRLEKGRLHPYFGICPNGTVIVDWGDNSATATLTGTSLTTVKIADHEYTSAGEYVITLTASSGNFVFFGTSNTSYILRKNNTKTANIHRVYTNAVQKIELGTGVGIGEYAFANCFSLASITIPSGVTSIGNYAFTNCDSLTDITIPNGITNIGTYVFYCCYALANITIPSGVTDIGAKAFYYCYSLASITIPSVVAYIRTGAFQNCTSLTNITIPSGVTSIEVNTFQNCFSLASITIPSGVTSIGNYAFQNCYSLANIVIPSGVTNIGTYAFSCCYALTNITIPSGVASIGAYAFQNCYSLASITIPSGVTSIGTTAFFGCYALANITIPSEVTSIEA